MPVRFRYNLTELVRLSLFLHGEHGTETSLVGHHVVEGLVRLGQGECLTPNRSLNATASSESSPWPEGHPCTEIPLVIMAKVLTGTSPTAVMKQAVGMSGGRRYDVDRDGARKEEVKIGQRYLISV